MLRLSLHPAGLAPRIANLGQWRAHLLERLESDAMTSGDPALAALHEELAAYPGGEPGRASTPRSATSPSRSGCARTTRELAFLSTRTTFSTALDVTVAELSIESFFPADEQTAQTMRALVSAP